MNKYLSDFIPAVIVKDWRQAYHAITYMCVMLLSVAGVWLIQANYLDEPGDATKYIYGLVGFILLGWVPFRAYSAVRGDTMVKGTNFLMLTPLTARQIVYSVWVSNVLQSVLFAALCAPIILWRQHDLGVGEDDATILLTLLALGAVFTAVFMLASRLHVILRIVFLFFCVVTLIQFLVMILPGMLLNMLGKTDIAAEQWCVITVVAAAIIALGVEISRRYYAPSSVNCSLVPRLLMLAPPAAAAALQWHGNTSILLWGQGVDLVNFACKTATLAAVLECMLPAERKPVHDKLAPLPLLRMVQVPGIGGAAIWFTLVTLLATALGTWHGLSAGAALTHADLEQAAATGLGDLYTSLLPLVIMAWLCKPLSDMRPVAYLVARAVFAILSVIPFISHAAWSTVIPGTDTAEPWQLATRAALCALLLGILLWKGRARKI